MSEGRPRGGARAARGRVHSPPHERAALRHRLVRQTALQQCAVPCRCPCQHSSEPLSAVPGRLLLDSANRVSNSSRSVKQGRSWCRVLATRAPTCAIRLRRHTAGLPVAFCFCVRIGSNHSHTLPFHVHPVHTACIPWPWVGHAHTDLLLELPTLCRLRAEVVDSLRMGGLHPLHVERAQHGLHTVRHKRAYIGADTCSVRILGSVRS